MRKGRILYALLLSAVLICGLLTSCSRDVKDRETNLTYQEKSYKGLYTGEITDGTPQGNGIFQFENNEGEYLIYEGTFKNGVFSETGNLRTDSLTIDLPTGMQTGKFEGSVTDGIPNGAGKFIAQDEEGDLYTYDGNWKNGVFDGYGELRWDNDSFMDKMGTYTKGRYIPEFYDLVYSLSTTDDIRFDVSDKAYAFMKDHIELFPVIFDQFSDEDNPISPYLDTSIEYKHLNKSSDKYGDKIMLVGGEVSQIFETVVDSENSQYTYTEIHLLDDNWDHYWIYFPGTCELYEGDYVAVYGLPLGSGSFDNTGGGTTSVEVLAGSELTFYASDYE